MLRATVTRTESERREHFRMRYEVMARALRWVSPEECLEGEEKDEYDSGQALSVLLKDGFNTIGTARLIFPGPIPLPIYRHFRLIPNEEIESKFGRILSLAEVSRFIIPKTDRYKHHELTLLLCKTLFSICVERGVSHVFVSIDKRFFRLLNLLGFPLSSIGSPEFYMGSETIPGIIPIHDLLERVKGRKYPLFKYLKGMEKAA